jgi:DNA-binding SARP family transcriptional activator
VYADRAINAPQMGIRATPDGYARLAALYEARGDRQNALKYYKRVPELWKNADPILQPRVKAAQARIAALGGDKK